MDEKLDRYTSFQKPQQATMPPYSRPSRRFRPLLALSLVILCVYVYARPLSPFSALPDMSLPSSLQASLTVDGNAPVQLEAHIMSKCPDARDCLRELILPTMVRTFDKVNFTLSFIGTPTENDGVACMHGPEECLGNIVLLCAASLYPDPKIYLGFTMCMIKDYGDIPQRSLIEDCALEHAIDFEQLDDCASRDDGGFGVGMLRDSVRRSSNAGVTNSCTVRLDEEFYCIRDGGEWKSCPHGPGVNDLVLEIEKRYRSS
ncbi:hypothetical protein VM1G_04172 [Cytospora mali]|uniref:Gamma-interferon-inducible lysosomal thiol reductase n=1 Tax=Cytospora mali TaxID=578113 RepID=A0A194VYH1_CYTMA|nr:hypothetical protein VM1G_04172 [Valsa mali]